MSVSNVNVSVTTKAIQTLIPLLDKEHIIILIDDLQRRADELDDEILEVALESQLHSDFFLFHDDTVGVGQSPCNSIKS